MTNPKPWDGIIVVSEVIPADTILLIELKMDGEPSSFVVLKDLKP